MLDVLKNLFSRSASHANAPFTVAPVALPGIDSLGAVSGKRVLLRASLNVPVQDGKVENAFRLKSIVSTVEALTARGARVILIGHIGRDHRESLRPVYEALGSMTPLSAFLPLGGEETRTKIDALQNGTVVMLENLRSDEREESNDAEFAALLASYAEVYVNDAFADSHRAHASIVGIPKLLKSAFGLSFIREYEALEKAMRPERPALLILGGAKFETKLPLIEKYLAVYDHVFVGGALANDLFKAKGFEVGTSLVAKEPLSLASLLQNKKLLLPVDVSAKSERGVRVVAPDALQPDESMLDVGPETIRMLEPYIMEAKTILWNGPLGNYEAGFSEYTENCAKVIAKSAAFSILGGGDTIATIEALHKENKFGFLSTAGGAMLVFLESGTLPGIESVLAAGN